MPRDTNGRLYCAVCEDYFGSLNVVDYHYAGYKGPQYKTIEICDGCLANSPPDFCVERLVGKVPDFREHVHIVFPNGDETKMLTRSDEFCEVISYLVLRECAAACITPIDGYYPQPIAWLE